MGSPTGRRWRLPDFWNSFAGVSRGRANRARGSAAPFLSTAHGPGEHLFPGARCEQEGSRWLTPFLFAAAPTIPFGERFETTVCRSGPEGAPQNIVVSITALGSCRHSHGKAPIRKGPCLGALSDRHLGLRLVGLGLPAPAPRLQLQRRGATVLVLVLVTFSSARRRVGSKAAWGAWWVLLMTVGLCFYLPNGVRWAPLDSDAWEVHLRVRVRAGGTPQDTWRVGVER